MGSKVSRFIRNYDAERRALKLLSRNDNTAAPPRAPRFESEQNMLRQVARDPILAEAVNKKDTQLLQNLTRVKVVSSSPALSPGDEQTRQQQRQLPQRRHFLPTGDLGVPEVPPESVPSGRLTLMQFQELLNTRQPQGSGLTSDNMQELLEFYAPLVQRSQTELRQLIQQDDTSDNQQSAVEDRAS